MAIAQRSVGVRRGYKPKTKSTMRRESLVLRRVAASLLGGARELGSLVADEIIYATMDTLRVMQYVRYELGFRTQGRVASPLREQESLAPQPERRFERGAFGTEPIRVLAKR